MGASGRATSTPNGALGAFPCYPRAMANDDLIEQIRELRAQVRRGDEAIRTVADLIEHCIALKTADRGYIEGALGGWLRRDYVRIVRGEPRPGLHETTPTV